MAVFVVAVTLLFIRLGVWQLERREERAIENIVLASRLTEAPIDLSAAIAAAGEDVVSLEYRPVTAEGTYRAELEKLVRNRTNRLGTAGFHVLTPLEQADGSLVIVNRGWVPLDADRVPTRFDPSSGVVTVTGWARGTERRPPTGPEDPPGPLDVLNRVDLDRIAGLYDAPVVPVWIQAGGDGTAQIPQPLALPDTSDPGPHLSYAIQWFSFATISLIGFVLAIRRAGSPRSRHLPPIG